MLQDTKPVLYVWVMFAFRISIKNIKKQWVFPIRDGIRDESHELFNRILLQYISEITMQTQVLFVEDMYNFHNPSTDLILDSLKPPKQQCKIVRDAKRDEKNR